MFQIPPEIILKYYHTRLEEVEAKHQIANYLYTRPAKPNRLLFGLGNLFVAIGEHLRSSSYPQNAQMSGLDAPSWEQVTH